MKIFIKSTLVLAIALTTFNNHAQADVVEAFTNNQLSTPGWSNPIGGDASNYIYPAPDGSYGIYLVDDQWSFNTHINFLPGETLSTWINPGPSPSANNAQGGRLYVGFDAGSNGAFSFVAASDTLQLGFENNTAAYATADFLGSVSQNYQDQWYLLTISLSSDGTTATADLYDNNGTTLLNTLTETGLSPTTDTGIALRGNGGAIVSTIAITSVPIPNMGIVFASCLVGLFGFKRRNRQV